MVGTPWYLNDTPWVSVNSERHDYPGPPVSQNHKCGEELLSHTLGFLPGVSGSEVLSYWGSGVASLIVKSVKNGSMFAFGSAIFL